MRDVDSKQRQRRGIRLEGYDYLEVGAYFVTICTKNQQCVFGNVGNEIVELSPIGKKPIMRGMKYLNILMMLNWMNLL